MLKTYWKVVKPGIIVGNLFSLAAGYFLAARVVESHLDIFLSAMLGTAMIIASGCVINNIFDRDIDSKMDRTCNRPLVQGDLSTDNAFIFALLLLLAGTFVLYTWVNALSAIIVLMGYIFYVFFYTMWYKRTSVYGTFIGGLSGAVPPLAGYVSLTNYINIDAVLLFAMFFLWQLPHSYAIAIFRQNDYEKAGIPLFPIVSGLRKARLHMQGYVVAFTIITLLLYFVGHASTIYLAVASIFCFGWLQVTFRRVRSQDYVSWSRSVFKWSLFVVTAISGVLGVETLVI